MDDGRLIGEDDPLDMDLAVTVFADVRALTKKEETYKWRRVVSVLSSPQERASKKDCPLLKLATFGDVPTGKGALRHDANMLEVHGVEGDYDGGKVSVDEAAGMLKNHGIEALIYTSPSHKPEAPRWRVLAPLADVCTPSERAGLVAKLNWALDGILGGESFTPSQTFYFGRVKGAPYETRHVAGRFLDQLPDLGETWPSKEKPTTQAVASPAGEADLEREAALHAVDGETIADLRSALAALKPARADERGQWIDVLEALASLKVTPFAEQALELAHEFSQRCLEKYDATYLDEKWAGMNPTRITHRSIFEWAQADGWVNPRSAGAVEESGGAVGLSCDIEFVDLAGLAANPPPPRQWVVKEWLPRGSVTLMFGRGGHGKSLMAQQLATAAANGLHWLGQETTAGPVIGLFCEDEPDELQRRQYALFNAEMLGAADASRRLFLDGRPGKFNTLVSFGRNGLAEPTELMSRIRTQCEALRPVLVILDNIAQMYAGQENDRSQVTQFCNELTGLARAFNCAVLVLGHTAKAEGSEYSGSTAWDAAVRSRLFLLREEDGTSTLKKLKANYSAQDEIRVRYLSGVFFVVPAGSGTSAEALEPVKPTIAQALKVFTSRQQSTSNVPTARNYLPRQMETEGMLGTFSRRLVELALGAMLDAGEVIPNEPLPWRNASRKAVHGLRMKE
jgi:hypothetical protein